MQNTHFYVQHPAQIIREQICSRNRSKKKGKLLTMLPSEHRLRSSTAREVKENRHTLPLHPTPPCRIRMYALSLHCLPFLYIFTCISFISGSQNCASFLGLAAGQHRTGSSRKYILAQWKALCNGKAQTILTKTKTSTQTWRTNRSDNFKNKSIEETLPHNDAAGGHGTSERRKRPPTRAARVKGETKAAAVAGGSSASRENSEPEWFSIGRRPRMRVAGFCCSTQKAGKRLGKKNVQTSVQLREMCFFFCHFFFLLSLILPPFLALLFILSAAFPPRHTLRYDTASPALSFIFFPLSIAPARSSSNWQL